LLFNVKSALFTSIIVHIIMTPTQQNLFFLLLNAVFLAEKEQFPIFNLWFDPTLDLTYNLPNLRFDPTLDLTYNLPHLRFDPTLDLTYNLPHLSMLTILPSSQLKLSWS